LTALAYSDVEIRADHRGCGRTPAIAPTDEGKVFAKASPS